MDINVDKNRHCDTFLCFSLQTEKLTFFCENCDQLTCRDCQLSDTHRGHGFKPTREIIPEARVLLQEGASDIKLKKNILEENISLLGTRLTEVTIKVVLS